MHAPITKSKGDIGLTQVIAHLERQGIKSALPIAEHLPFDLIAINSDAKLSRVSVKYCSAKRDKLIVRLTTVYSNRKGRHASRVNLDEIDAYAIFCPETETCYYVTSATLEGRKSDMTLRLNRTSERRLGDNITINWACDFVDPSVIFK